MLNIKIRLTKEVHDILCMFGTLDNVANRVLSSMPDMLDYETYDSGARKTPYRVTIDNNEYEALYKIYGPNSPRISLSRILSYFVYNELYVQLNWKPVSNTFINKKNTYIHNKRGQCLILLQQIYNKGTSKQQHLIEQIIELLKEL